MKPFKIGDIIVFLNNPPINNFYGVILKVWKNKHNPKETMIKFYNLKNLSDRPYTYFQSTLFDYVKKKYLKIHIK